MPSIRINSLPATTSVLTDDILPMDGLTTRKIKPIDMINSVRPLATQVQAEAGTDSATTMTPLAGAQQIAAKLPSTAAGKAILNAADAAAQRSLLSLGGSALLSVGTTAGTVAAGDDSRITGAAQKSANLSDLASAGTARTNLGLGNSATLNIGTTAGTVAAGNDIRFAGVAGIADQATAEAGTDNSTLLSPLRGTQLVDAKLPNTSAGRLLLNGADAAAQRAALALGSAALLNAGATANLVVQRNSDAGLLATSSQASQAFNHGHFGGSFLSATASNVLELDKIAVDAGVGPRFTLALTSEVEGGHLNGPASMRTPVWIFSGRKDWLNNPRPGEIDGIYMLIQGALESDHGGLIVGAYKVFDDIGLTGSGSLTTSEFVGNRVAPGSATPTNSVRGFLALQEGSGGVLERNGASFYAWNELGSDNQAFVAVNATAAFKWWFSGYANHNDPNSMRFGAGYDGEGFIQLGSPSDHMKLRYSTADHALYVRNNVGSTNLLSLTETGVLSAYAGMSVANGSTLKKREFHVLRTIDFPSIPANSAASSGNIAITGAQINDHVTISPGAGYNTPNVSVTGTVVSANTIQFFAQNIGTSAADIASTIWSVKVEGFA